MGIGFGGPREQAVGEQSDARFVVADVRCPEAIDLLRVRDGFWRAPAVDATGAIGNPGRGELHAQALELRNEYINVEF